MKVLVYGCGVIGSQLIHVLCKAGNDVTVVSKSRWGEVLKEKGLHIRHYLQRKETVDHFRVTDTLPDEEFDAVFSVMQGIQQESVLEELGKAKAPMVIFVGNNPLCEETEKKFMEHCEGNRSVLFGFQGTAGGRFEDRVTVLHWGDGSMTVGKLHKEVSAAERITLISAFSGTDYSLRFEDDMHGWLWSHAAFILPAALECYALGGDLRNIGNSRLSELLDAIRECYALLKRAGIKIRPEGDESLFDSRLKMTGIKSALHFFCKTKIGELAASVHCKNAVSEMEWLDLCFKKLRLENPDVAMPAFDRLRRSAPSWEELHETYDNRDKSEDLKTPPVPVRKIVLAAGSAILLTAAVSAFTKAVKDNK